MKSGMNDVLWPDLEDKILTRRIKDPVSERPSPPIVHAYIPQLAEIFVNKSLARKTSFFKARKEFSRVFLRQMLNHQKLRRRQLADLMGVSSRTLHRHISS